MDMRRTRCRLILVVGWLYAVTLTATTEATEQRGQGQGQGQSFLLTFFPNYNTNVNAVLIITSYYNATVYVSNPNDPDNGTHRQYHVQAGGSAHVTLQGNVIVSTNQVVERKAVLVVATHPVSVYGLSIKHRTSDGYTAIPMEALGTRYVVATYEYNDAQLVVAAAENDTEVTVTVRVLKATTCGGVVLDTTDSAQMHFRLHAQDTVRVLCDGDITGSVVNSSKPVAVISGNSCAKVPTMRQYRDHLVEMMVPVQALGKRYLLHAFQGRTTGAIYRVVPGQRGTSVSYGPGLTPNAIGDLPFQEFTIQQTQTGLITAGMFWVTADQPILVVGYTLGQGETVAGITPELGDPLMTSLTSPDLAPSDYVLDLDITPRHSDQAYECYVTVVVKEEHASGVFLDTQPVALQSSLDGQGLSYGVQRVTSWPARLYHSNGSSLAADVHCSADGASLGFPAGHTLPDFTGVNECASSPCSNGGICHGVGSSFRCYCLGVFGGQLCQEDTVNDCDSGPCSNGGVCSDGVQSFNCTCPPGYSGAACEEEITTEGATTEAPTTEPPPPPPSPTTASSTTTITSTTSTTTTTTTTSRTTRPPPSLPKRLCPCSCKVAQFVNSLDDADREAISQQRKELVQEIKEELTVNAKNTSKEKHRLQSATDSRPSAAGIGLVGVSLLVVVLGLIVVMDLATLVSFIVVRIRNLQKKSLKVKADPALEEAGGGSAAQAASFHPTAGCSSSHSPVKAVSSLGSDCSEEGQLAHVEVSRFVESVAAAGGGGGEERGGLALPQHRSSRRKHLLHVRPETILVHVTHPQGQGQGQGQGDSGGGCSGGGDERKGSAKERVPVRELI
ncbi:uncharacterized protein LOC143284269 [Babylonia areolata]|uniref:uncharacterized protein LOC143284269 n=1 Tax=Babylonia areolata TaxID=304850 RepID=UPI003FD2CE5E